MNQSMLSRRLSVGNVIEILLLAEAHNSPVLLERATVVFKMHIDDLKKDARWNKLKTNVDLLLKLVGSYGD